MDHLSSLLSLLSPLSLTHALLSATREPISPLPFSNHQNLLFFSSVLFEEHAVSHFILPHPLSLSLSLALPPSLQLSLYHPIPLSPSLFLTLSLSLSLFILTCAYFQMQYLFFPPLLIPFSAITTRLTSIFMGLDYGWRFFNLSLPPSHPSPPVDV